MAFHCVLLLLILQLVLFYINNDNHVWARKAKAFVDNTYLIEFHSETDLTHQLASLMDNNHEDNNINIQHHVRHTFKHMDAVSLTFNNSYDASQFFNQTRSKVKRTWPVVRLLILRLNMMCI